MLYIVLHFFSFSTSILPLTFSTSTFTPTPQTTDREVSRAIQEIERARRVERSQFCVLSISWKTVYWRNCTLQKKIRSENTVIFMDFNGESDLHASCCEVAFIIKTYRLLNYSCKYDSAPIQSPEGLWLPWSSHKCIFILLTYNHSFLSFSLSLFLSLSSRCYIFKRRNGNVSSPRRSTSKTSCWWN